MTVDELIQEYGDFPALSIRQPWALLITEGPKDIENRTWKTSYRGWLYIHAALRSEAWAEQEFAPIIKGILKGNAMWAGGVVGMAFLDDVVTESDSAWFEGPFGFVLKDAKPLPFTACRGALSLFDFRRGN